MITIYTIGFTKKSAEKFFELLRQNGVKNLIDVRIYKSSQLAGFGKGKDLAYFVKQICGIDYEHIVDFAPTKELLDQWHKQEVDWPGYIRVYTGLLDKRNIMAKYGVEKFDGSCLLCSEDTVENCHRRLLAEYVQNHTNEEVKIVHLK